MSKKVCFLAGLTLHPLVGDNETIQWRQEAKEYFDKYVYRFITDAPEEYSVPDDFNDMGTKESLRFDMRKVRGADVILVNLKDIDKSISACDEIFYAFIQNKPVIGFLEKGSTEDIHPWKLEQLDRVFVGKNAMTNAISYISIHYS